MTYIEPKDNNADDTLFIKTAQNMLIPQREEFDFTEELWLVLKGKLIDLLFAMNLF
jgi:hypothetical protein